jgi:hypothetical protein
VEGPAGVEVEEVDAAGPRGEVQGLALGGWVMAVGADDELRVAVGVDGLAGCRVTA